jgi:long-chain acyl-CoA synthetase
LIKPRRRRLQSAPDPAHPAQDGDHVPRRLEQEIIAYVKSKIASFKAPRTIRFVDELPRSEAGKLMKSQLKAMYTQN